MPRRWSSWTGRPGFSSPKSRTPTPFPCRKWCAAMGAGNCSGRIDFPRCTATRPQEYEASISFILGNLAGRALVSYAIVLLVCCPARRLDWRAALRSSVRWDSWLAVAALTGLGMGGALVRKGGALGPPPQAGGAAESLEPPR